MREVSEPDELRHQVAAARTRRERVGLVPLVGGMHDGQAALLRAAHAQCDLVVVVTGLPAATLDGLPGHLLWRPAPAPAPSLVRLDASVLGSERAARLDDRLAAQVLALLNAAVMVRPDRLFVPSMHLLLCWLLRRALVEVGAVDVDVQVLESLRAGDGLLASHDADALTGADRERATLLPRALDEVERLVGLGERSSGRLVARCAVIAAAEPEVDLRFVELLEGDTLEPLSALHPGQDAWVVGGMRVAGRQVVDVRRLSVPDQPAAEPAAAGSSARR